MISKGVKRNVKCRILLASAIAPMEVLPFIRSHVIESFQRLLVDKKTDVSGITWIENL